MRVEAILTPAEIAALPARDLRGSTCVVFDVLRATSTMLAAFAGGARRIFPVLTPEEARRLRRERLPDALLGGEREGVRLEDFDLGNSPREYTPEAVTGRDIVTTTTNGTVALRACAGAGEVIVGAWVNLAVLAAQVRAGLTASGHLVLVCAGTGPRFALEDGLAAGALLARLGDAADASAVDDASNLLLALYARHGRDPTGAMRDSENGRRLRQIGLADDVAWCAHTTSLDWIATLRDGVITGRRIQLNEPFS